MSWHIVSDVYKAKLGGPTRKAIAAKLADWADDDGCGIYPSVQRIADQTENSVRTVQYTLRTFVSEGLLIKVREGGKGPRSTTEYRFNLKALAALPRTRQADGEKGATGAPLADDVRVQPATKKGAPVAPEPLREPEERERHRHSLCERLHSSRWRLVSQNSMRSERSPTKWWRGSACTTGQPRRVHRSLTSSRAPQNASINSRAEPQEPGRGGRTNGRIGGAVNTRPVGKRKRLHHRASGERP